MQEIEELEREAEKKKIENILTTCSPNDQEGEKVVELKEAVIDPEVDVQQHNECSKFPKKDSAPKY